jgi:BioD-like phosphotransacetylase family protein
MKSLYVTSVECFSGKTAACLALGTRFQANGYRVGYMKPLSLQPIRVGGKITDEDAIFVQKVLSLKGKADEIAPVVITKEYLREHLQSGYAERDAELMQRVKKAFDKASLDQDVLLLEGGASLREGYTVGLPTLAVAEALSSHVLIVVRYRDEMRVLDDTLASHKRLGQALTGIIINRVPADASDFVSQIAAPYLESRGIPVLAILPESRSLAALTVAELVAELKAEVLTSKTDQSAMVENLTVGAMTAETALSRFRKQTHKAVITGGDRTDIQLAALETSTACLILTGNLRPSPLIIKQAEEYGVTVMLVHGNTMETIEAIDRIFGKTRLGQAAKLNQFQELLDQHLDYERLTQLMGL